MANIKKILLVEDEPDLVTLYQAAFRMNPEFELKVASDVESALSIIMASRFDLILLDIIIPAYKNGIIEYEKREGLGLLEMIRQSPKFNSIKVLALTNLDSLEDRKRSQKLGVLEYVVKADFTPQEVVNKASNYLK
jgi:DNA-binding response OmpR family regulator